MTARIYVHPTVTGDDIHRLYRDHRLVAVSRMVQIGQARRLIVELKPMLPPVWRISSVQGGAMNVRQRITLATGLHGRTDRPALQTSALDPLAIVAAIAASAALIFLLAAVEYRDQLTEVRECVKATR
jgi:hypothetical protein